MPFDLSKAYPGRAGSSEAAPDDGGWLGAMGRLYSATVADSDAVRNSMSSRLMLREAYQRRIEAIKAATGASMDNPMDDPNQPPGLGGGFMPVRGLTPTQAAVRWGLQAEKLAKKFPGQRQIILGDKTVAEEADDLARQKARDLSEAAADPRLGTLGKLAASFAGGAVGMVRDPMQAPLLFAGGGFLGSGKTIIGSIARTMASEAIVNAGAEAAVQPFEQSRRQRLGMEHGAGLAAGNIAEAGAVGAAFGAGGKLAGAAVRKMLGARTIADLEAAAKEAGVELDETNKAMARQAELSDAADASAFGTPPAGLTPDEASMLKAQAIGAAEFPTEAARAVGPVPKPERPPEVARVVDESQKGESGAIGGKPVTYASFDPKDIGTDARAFQYKDGGDAAGVTDRLAGVTRWDPMASGKVFVFERADGAKVIADGHQRLGLAKRLEAAGQDVKLDGYVFREADGWTVPDVRALAAKKNLQEGSGSVLDAARILRDRPDILDASLPTTGPMIRKAQGLARLSDDAWRMVTNGLVPDSHGALVGEMEANPARHAAILADLKRYAPDTEREARLLVQEIQQSGVSHETQTDMFGAFDVAKTLIGERVKVLDQAMQQLRTDKRVFQQLSANADLIEQAGNSLDRTGNRVRAVSADFVATLIEKMARRRGEMSDLLTDAARAVSEGKTIANQSRRFLDDVKDLIERRGFSRLMQDAQRPEPVLKPAVAPEPGSAEALRIAEAAAPIPEPDTAAELSLWDVLPDGANADGTPRFVSAVDQIDRADRTQHLATMAELCTMP
ncbi:hypothetical protein [Pleomorphomonas koreensis]|uniref:hypothetical protein n=1 Tax=Pleomorphomonas koreensis TaxID=257440 RepID=UPI0003F645DC|nr:hypothetical protein [Pleomorphomonas koreensis]